MSDISARSWCEKAGVRWREAVDKDALAADLARFITVALQHDIDTSGRASLVVSGGSTPAPVFHQLSQTPIDWQRVTVTLADERWVAPGHADSNESLVRDTLLKDAAAEAGFVSLYRADRSATDAVKSVSFDVDAMHKPFTVSILGMGNDGHTASLFPDAPAAQLSAGMMLNSAESIAVLTPPSVSQTRITLTRAALLNSTHRILHITGNAKERVLADALAESATDSKIPGEYSEGLKPIVGLLTSQPQAARVFWSP